MARGSSPLRFNRAVTDAAEGLAGEYPPLPQALGPRPHAARFGSAAQSGIHSSGYAANASLIRMPTLYVAKRHLDLLLKGGPCKRAQRCKVRSATLSPSIKNHRCSRRIRVAVGDNTDIITVPPVPPMKSPPSSSPGGIFMRRLRAKAAGRGLGGRSRPLSIESHEPAPSLPSFKTDNGEFKESLFGLKAKKFLFAATRR